MRPTDAFLMEIIVHPALLMFYNNIKTPGRKTMKTQIPGPIAAIPLLLLDKKRPSSQSKYLLKTLGLQFHSSNK